MGVLGFTHFFQEIEESSPCDTITLGDNGGDIPFVGTVVMTQGAFITGGQGPYTVEVVSGSLPGGATGINAIDTGGGVYVWTFTGSNFTTFGRSTFTLGGTDANGCAITEKEYTIEVWYQVEESTPVPISEGLATMVIPVSLPGITLGTNGRLERFKINALVSDHVDTIVVLEVPTQAESIPLTNANLTGSDFVDTEFVRGATDLISNGTAPYTGEFSPSEYVPAGFDQFNTHDADGGWNFYLVSAQTGEITNATLTFKPL